ncbi:hypothetical protein J3R82DRAFT_4372 [Butyriboletus roseoflavus]|nr:hypothetical protein J3R82DRAFT_4372 [Butyriboletus roseoflavus]
MATSRANMAHSHNQATLTRAVRHGWRMGHTNILVIQPTFRLDYLLVGKFAPKAVGSRDAEDAAAPGRHEDVVCEAVLYSAQEDRERIEKSLLRKLDTRMSILVLIYILNYVSIPCTRRFVTFMWQEMA